MLAGVADAGSDVAHPDEAGMPGVKVTLPPADAALLVDCYCQLLEMGCREFSAGVSDFGIWTERAEYLCAAFGLNGAEVQAKAIAKVEAGREADRARVEQLLAQVERGELAGAGLSGNERVLEYLDELAATAPDRAAALRALLGEEPTRT